jgi:uncharacterized membrane protein (DUF373 family)
MREHHTLRRQFRDTWANASASCSGSWLRWNAADRRRMFRKFPAIEHTDVHRVVWRYFEWAQDAIAASLASILLVVMGKGLWTLARVALFESRDARVILPQIFLLLILVELFRTILYYLREHRVAVGLMIEVSIVSILRELLLSPPGGSALQSFGIAVLLLVLGMLLAAERYTAPREQGVGDHQG